LGATRQGISKELKALEQQAAIKLNYGKIHINNLSNLIEAFDRLTRNKLIYYHLSKIQ